MKRSTQLTWGLLWGLGLVMLGSVHAQSLPFKSTNGYKFSIPKGWRMAFLNGPDTVLLAPPPLQGTNITVVTNDAPPGATLEAVREAVNRSKLHPAKGFRQLSQTLTALGGERVLDTQIAYALDPPLGKMWARQVIFLKHGKEYELTCTTALVDKSQGVALFDTLLKSLQWTAPFAPFTDEEFKNINTSDPAYAYVVPAGWTLHTDQEGGRKAIILAGPDDHGSTPNISITSAAAAANETVEAQQAAVNAQSLRTKLHATLQSQWFTSVDGAPALETCCVQRVDKKEVWSVQVFLRKGGDKYLLTGTFPSTGYEKDQAVFDRLLASVRWSDQ